MRSSPTFAGLDRQPLHDERVQGRGLRPLERLRMTDVGVRATWRDHGRGEPAALRSDHRAAACPLGRSAPERPRCRHRRPSRPPRVADRQGEPLRQDRRDGRDVHGDRSARGPAGSDSPRGVVVKKPCLTCGELTDGSYCPDHRPRRPRGRQLAKLRTRVFAAYGRRCRDCGRSYVPLEVHHVNCDPTDNRIGNLAPLCRTCHHEATFPGI